jgi:hypothetical protein
MNTDKYISNQIEKGNTYYEAELDIVKARNFWR